MRPFLRAILSLVGMRLGLTLVAGIGLLTQFQCGGGGGDGGDTGQPPAGVTGDVKAIARENALPGTGAWQIGNPSRSGEINAYSSRESYPAGADGSISLSANPAGDITGRGSTMGRGGRQAPRRALGRAVPGGGSAAGAGAGAPAGVSMETADQCLRRRKPALRSIR